METQVRTPQSVFLQPQRLVVPLFQRRYAWNEVDQWEPLWRDVVRMAERFLSKPNMKHYPHFLGAVVLQQVPNTAGTLQVRTIIDGQQRLTTLQLFFDALHAELVAINAVGPALRIESLVVNAEAYCRHAEDRFKVWPTNRDRPCFNAVMGAKPPVDYGAVGHADEKIVAAHRFFAQQIREWLEVNGDADLIRRAEAIETVVRDLIQLVVIDLAADENAQEIFETLNARGAQLTSADLIKNLIFQRLLESGADVQREYDSYWRDFETAFWESEVSVGRMRYPRSAIYLNHWLVAQTGEEIVAREVFARFKQYTIEESREMSKLLARIHRSANVYKGFVESGCQPAGPVDAIGLFSYRTGVLESEVIKPLVLFLLDPDELPIPAPQLVKALACIESWMVRRMLVRVTSKSYTQFVSEIITHLRDADRSAAGIVMEQFLASQTSTSRYWPDDIELRDELRVLPAYRKIGRGRLRMILEAIEDFHRGWMSGTDSFCEERVAKGKLVIEHIMPQKWNVHWPHPDGAKGEGERDALINTLGNLTLLTRRLNSKVSHGPWLGETGKRAGLQEHSVLKMNSKLQQLPEWSDADIRARTDEMANIIAKIWPVPPNHKSAFAREKVRPRHKLDLSDLIGAGWLEPSTTLVPRLKKHSSHSATLLPDGRIDLKGLVYTSPSEAAKAIVGSQMNGWWFFLVDAKSKRSLKDVRIEYLQSIADEFGDESQDDDDD